MIISQNLDFIKTLNTYLSNFEPHYLKVKIVYSAQKYEFSYAKVWIWFCQNCEYLYIKIVGICWSN